MQKGHPDLPRPRRSLEEAGRCAQQKLLQGFAQKRQLLELRSMFDALADILRVKMGSVFNVVCSLSICGFEAPSPHRFLRNFVKFMMSNMHRRTHAEVMCYGGHQISVDIFRIRLETNSI